MADWYKPTKNKVTADEIEDAVNSGGKEIDLRGASNPSMRGRWRPSQATGGGGIAPGTDAFLRNLPRSAAMGLTQSGTFTMGAGAGLAGAGARAMVGDEGAMEGMDVVREGIAPQPGPWDRFKDAAHALNDTGQSELLPQWMLSNIAKDKAEEYRGSPDFTPGRYVVTDKGTQERSPTTKEYIGAREAMINAINFGEQSSDGFFSDLAGAQEQFYGAADDATGGALHYPEEDVALMSPWQRKALGFTQTAAELFGPSRIVGAAVGGAKMGAKMFGKKAADEGAGLGSRIWQGAKDQINLPNIGMLGGAAIGAAYSGDEIDPDDHAGQVADAAEKAAFGSLGGMSNAMMVRWGLGKRKAVKEQMDQIRDERMQATNRMEVGEHYGREMRQVSELAERAGIDDVPLPVLSHASSPLGASLRRLTDKLGPEQQEQYGDAIDKARVALDEKAYTFKESLKQEPPPEMVGKVGQRTTTEINENTKSVMRHLRDRESFMEHEFGRRYGEIADEFDQHKLTTIKLSGTNVAVGDLMKAMREVADKIEGKSQTGLQVEDVGRSLVTSPTGSMTTHVAEGTGGLRRFEKGLKEFKKAGKATPKGVTSRMLVQMVHNANEMLRKAERTGNEAWISDAKFIKEKSYGLLKAAGEQGLLPPDLVNDFLKLQGDRRAFFQLFRGDDHISRSLLDMSSKTATKRAEEFRKGFISASGKISQADVVSLYRAVGREGKGVVDEFLADQIWARTGRDPKKMYKFYEDNFSLLSDPNYSGLQLMTDRIMFENIGLRAGGKGVLDFVSKAGDDQVSHLIRVSSAHGKDTMGYIGHRILDEISGKDVGDRARFLKNNADKLDKFFGYGQMRDKLDAVRAFTKLEENLGTHTKYAEGMPGNIVSKTYGKFTNTIRKLTGMSAVTLNSMGRAMFRSILSPGVFVSGVMIPKVSHFWADYIKYKHLMRTFSQHAAREPDKALKFMSDFVDGKMDQESAQFLRTIGASLNETFQPANFTQEDVDFYKQMTEGN